MLKRKTSFNNDLQEKYPAFRKGRDEYEAERMVCGYGTYGHVHQTLAAMLQTWKSWNVFFGDNVLTYGYFLINISPEVYPPNATGWSIGPNLG